MPETNHGIVAEAAHSPAGRPIAGAPSRPSGARIRATALRELYASPTIAPSRARQVSLLDLLDRLQAGGVVTHGEITLAAGDIDLVELRLGVLVSAVRTAVRT